MKETLARRAVAVSLVVLTMIYVVALIYFETQNHFLSQIFDHPPVFITMAAMAFFSWLLRYFRWHWLLSKAGEKFVFFTGLLAYLSGFAYTATPGKVGELIRIRYFHRMGVTVQQTITAFFWERALDVFVIFLLALPITYKYGFLWHSLVFVGLIVLGLTAIALFPQCWRKSIHLLRRIRLTILARLARKLLRGLFGVRHWLHVKTVFVSLLLGIVAWTIIAVSFLYLLHVLGVAVQLEDIGIYPLAMLIGAASFIPGGVGSTEAVITMALLADGLSWDLAAFSAVIIRVANLWTAVGVGGIAMLYLENRVESFKK